WSAMIANHARTLRYVLLAMVLVTYDPSRQFVLPASGFVLPELAQETAVSVTAMLAHVIVGVGNPVAPDFFPVGLRHKHHAGCHILRHVEVPENSQFSDE